MSQQASRKLVLLGWGAADWKLITPLLDAGRLPHLQSVIDRGVMGSLVTPEPAVSPMLWTSIVTGKTADQHGVLTYLEPDPCTGGVRRVTNSSRKAKALWNILDQSGVRSHVVNWFASHPAEPVDGVFVSDAFTKPARFHTHSTSSAPSSVYPPSLEESLAELRIDARELRGEDLAPFVPDLGKIDQGRDKRLVPLAVSLASTITTHAVTTWILENESWRFLAVCYDAVEQVSRHFMRYYPPRMDDVSEEDFALYQGVVSGMYCFSDMMLGRILQLAGPDATIMIVSGHGFHSDHLRPKGKAALAPEPLRNPEAALLWNRPEGMVCLAGPDIRRDELISGANLLDISPTVLALFGLPAGKDMPGSVLAGAFAQAPSIERIPSWEDVDGEKASRASGAEQEAVLETENLLSQLEALGYVDAPSDEVKRQVESLRTQRSYNLARLHLAAGHAADAVPLFEELAQENPDAVSFRLYLAQAYFESGQLKQCRAVVVRALDGDRGGTAADFIFGDSSLTETDLRRRIVELATDEGVDRGAPRLWSLVGSAYLRLKRWEEAERAYRSAIAMDRCLPEAHAGLAVALLKRGAPRRAAESALEAVSLRGGYAEAHYYLGVALAESGRLPRAIRAFESCLKLRPRTPSAHEWLATIHEQATGNKERATLHRQLARELEELRETPATARGAPRTK